MYILSFKYSIFLCKCKQKPLKLQIFIIHNKIIRITENCKYFFLSRFIKRVFTLLIAEKNSIVGYSPFADTVGLEPKILKFILVKYVRVL